MKNPRARYEITFVSPHELELKSIREKLAKVEEEIDKLVAQLYGLADDELREVKGCLAIPKCEEVEGEEIHILIHCNEVISSAHQ